MIGDELDDDPNQNSGISAVSNASAGDWKALCARLIDPAVTLTMFEREWLARHVEPGKRGRLKEAQEPLLFWWFRNAEGLDRGAAVWHVCQALRRTTASDKDAIERAIRRAGGDKFDPGEWWHQRVQWYRDGLRDQWILPPALASQLPDFATFLRDRTE